MSLSITSVTFYYMAAGSVASAILAVTRRNPVHSILWVLALFLHVAGMYLLLGGEFLAAVQTIVYAGAILIFYLFVQMLIDLPEQEAAPRFSRHWPLAALAAGALAAVIGWLNTSPAAPPQSSYSLKLEDVGRALFGPYALPFEMASLLLLAAIVGAVVLARRRTEA